MNVHIVDARGQQHEIARRITLLPVRRLHVDLPERASVSMGQVLVQGWAFSWGGRRIVEVQAQLGDSAPATVPYGLHRPDVATAYNDSRMGHCGFEGALAIDRPAITRADTLVIRATDDVGDVETIGVPISVVSPDDSLCEIERIDWHGDRLELEGWFAWPHAAAPRTVRVFLGDVALDQSTQYRARPELTRRFPYLPAGACRGFVFSGRVPPVARPAAPPPAAATLVVECMDGNGRRFRQTANVVRQPGAPTPASGDRVNRVVEAVARIGERLAREPTILDWHSGLPLDAAIPRSAVCSPPAVIGSTLPYLDATVDVAIVSADDPARVAEARRVAAVATIALHDDRIDVPGTAVCVRDFCDDINRHSRAQRDTSHRGVPVAGDGDAAVRISRRDHRGRRCLYRRDRSSVEPVGGSPMQSSASCGTWTISGFFRAAIVPRTRRPAMSSCSSTTIRCRTPIGCRRCCISCETIHRLARSAASCSIRMAPCRRPEPSSSQMEVDGTSAGTIRIRTGRPTISCVRSITVLRHSSRFGAGYFWMWAASTSCSTRRTTKTSTSAFGSGNADTASITSRRVSSFTSKEPRRAPNPADTESPKHHQTLNQQTFIDKWRAALTLQPPPSTQHDSVGRWAWAAARGRPRVLVCAPRMPEFDRESGSQRTFEVMEFLQEAGWAVTFLALESDAGDRYVRVLQQRGVATYAGADSPLAGDESLEDIDELIAHGRFDLAILTFWHIGEGMIPRMRSASPSTRVIVDSIDLHFLREARRALRHHAGHESATLPADFADRLTREMHTYAAADAVLTVSQQEADVINDMTGGSGLAYAVPLMEDSGSVTARLSRAQRPALRWQLSARAELRRARVPVHRDPAAARSGASRQASALRRRQRGGRWGASPSFGISHT